MASESLNAGDEIVTIFAKESKELLDSGYAYLDVRTADEFIKGHVAADKVLNVPYLLNTPEGMVKNPDFLKEVSQICGHEQHLVVGCRSGVRSRSATADLVSNGFEHVNNMAGGYLAWVENEFPVKIQVAD